MSAGKTVSEGNNTGSGNCDAFRQRSRFVDITAEADGGGKPHYGEVRAGEVIHIALDSGRIRRERGWNPGTDFESGVKKTVPFYRRKLEAAE